MPTKKFFTLEEANSYIPQLLQDVPRIQKLTFDLGSKFPDVKKAWEKAKFNGGSVEGGGYLAVALILNKLVEGIESKGIIIKGINEGLVDFPAIRDGREVYLCWKAPEKEIQYWHDINAGFAGRKPI